MDNESNIMFMGGAVSAEELLNFRTVLETADINITQARRPRPILPHKPTEYPKPPEGGLN